MPLDAVVAGDPIQMGLEQGVALRSRIQRSAEVLASLEAFQLMKPRWMPYPMFRWISERKAVRALASPLVQDFPDAAARLAGIARGAGAKTETAAVTCRRQTPRRVRTAACVREPLSAWCPD